MVGLFSFRSLVSRDVVCKYFNIILFNVILFDYRVSFLGYLEKGFYNYDCSWMRVCIGIENVYLFLIVNIIVVFFWIRLGIKVKGFSFRG